MIDLSFHSNPPPPLSVAQTGLTHVWPAGVWCLLLNIARVCVPMCVYVCVYRVATIYSAGIRVWAWKNKTLTSKQRWADVVWPEAAAAACYYSVCV